jgi:predicted phosphoribosyltransferase
MYFKSRVAAGEELATQIAHKFRSEPCAVVALGDGSVMVAAQIAMELQCVMMLLLAEGIILPREDAAIAGISQDGSFSYNHKYSQGEIDEFVSEYYHFIEQEKMSKISQIHRAANHGALLRKDLLRDRNVILVSDGLRDGFILDVAQQFLKTVRIKRLVVATPFASVPAVDRMHILADEIYCLNVIEDYISTDHYYDTQDVPKHDKIIATIEKIVSHWKK